MELGFQLYSARKFDLVEALRTVSAAGYTRVETYGTLSGDALGGLYADVDGLRRELDRNGLSAPTGHFGPDLLRHPDKTLPIAAALGTKLIICPHIPPDQRPQSIPEWEEFARRLEAIAAPYRDAGYAFGYHNHDFEFATLEDGRLPIDILVGTAPSVEAEVDVAWIVRAGADPMPWIRQNGPRIAAVHVKDIAPAGEAADEGGWADLGEGTMPWGDLLETLRTGTSARYLVAEHDNPLDVERFARRSMAAFKRLTEAA